MPQSDGWLALADKIVRTFEGCHKDIGGSRFMAYPDPASGGDPWTIGWGSTGPGIAKGTIWTRAQCDARLLHDLNAVYGPAVDKLTEGELTPGEKAALTSFAYNLGAAKLGRSTLLKMHNAGNRRAAADQFLKWVYGNGKVMRGLVRRREAERALYLGIPRP